MEPEPFGGEIGRYHWESTPWWPEDVRADPDAPNVVLIVLDDVGFAQLGCYGSDIDTPVLDGLARRGLRYTNFHTTALCSPTRACLLTGRNHHSNGMGRIIDLATGFPGYNARIPRSNGFLPEILVPRGYAAWAVGKWHLTPEDECHLAASRSRWPLGRGFERWYGFFGGEAHQFAPVLWSDNDQTTPPRTYEEGYHLTEDLADQAVRCVTDLRAVDDDKPFFLYFATGACHSPHQAPADWIDRYRGHFDAGWDDWRERTFERQIAEGLVPPQTQLSPRPEWVPAWEELSARARRVYARYMEAFAGFLSHTDHQIGRVLDHLDRTGDLDNTLVIAVSDNGASSEGGPTGSLNDARAWNVVPRTVEEAAERLDEIGGPRIHNNYPWGWTVAGNTPFRRWKREVHEGGVADPLVVYWPRGIGDAGGGMRHQFVHAIDIAPMILDAVGVDAPRQIDGVPQRPLEGASFLPTLADPDAPAPRTTQYYEMLGCRAIYHDGWKAVVYHPIQAEEPGLDTDAWELYDVTADPSECDDLADTEPERLKVMVDLWWAEAEKYQVLPLDNRPFSEFVLDRPRPPERDRYVYYPDAAMVPEPVAVNLKNRSYLITAEIDVAEDTGSPEGVIVAEGSVLGGWSLHLVGGLFSYVHNVSGYREYRLDASIDLEPGEHTLGFRFERSADFAGRATLVVDGRDVAGADFAGLTLNRYSITGDGLTVGYALGIPPCDDYTAPFRFTAGLRQVVVDVRGAPYTDPDAEADHHVRTQ